jgi:hypothetical protein
VFDTKNNLVDICLSQKMLRIHLLEKMRHIWVDDTFDDSNVTSERKTKDPRHHELYMPERD